MGDRKKEEYTIQKYSDKLDENTFGKMKNVDFGEETWRACELMFNCYDVLNGGIWDKQDKNKSKQKNKQTKAN